MTGASARPSTPTSANSILTFAEGLRIHRTPSPTDVEVEQIWEAARTAAPIFPDLQLPGLNPLDIDEATRTEIPMNFHLGPAQRALVHDTTDAAGHRRSVLLVYEADDDKSTPSSPASTPFQNLYDECVTDYTHLSPGQSQAWPPRSSSRPNGPAATSASTSAFPTTIAKSGQGREKPRLYKFKQAFKLAKPPTASSSFPPSVPKTSAQSTNLPKVQAVDVSSTSHSRPQPAQPVPRKTVGHADRMTRWGDFSQYKAEEESAEQTSLRPPPLNLNKPLPDIPHFGSHLRMTRIPGTLLTSTAPPLPTAQDAPPQRKSKHRRTAVYAGSLFSSQELSEEEVIDAYASSRPTSPVGTQTPPTSDDESEGERERRELLEHLNRICPPSISEATERLESPYRSPAFSNSINDEIGRLHSGLGRTFDPDDEDDKSPMVDTFVHAGHTSFLITERLDQNTIRSMYGTQERRDGDSPTDDPTKAIWNNLRSQVGGGGWNGE